PAPAPPVRAPAPPVESGGLTFLSTDDEPSAPEPVAPARPTPARPTPAAPPPALEATSEPDLIDVMPMEPAVLDGLTRGTGYDQLDDAPSPGLLDGLQTSSVG